MTSGTYRPPSDAVSHMTPTANWDGFERRCCPNCRLYFDAAEDSDAVFCSQACERRHERGELKADGGTVESGTEQLTKDELYEEIIEVADLPPKRNTASYAFRREHLAELLRYLRTETDRSEEGTDGE